MGRLVAGQVGGIVHIGVDSLTVTTAHTRWPICCTPPTVLGIDEWHTRHTGDRVDPLVIAIDQVIGKGDLDAWCPRQIGDPQTGTLVIRTIVDETAIRNTQRQIAAKMGNGGTIGGMVALKVAIVDINGLIDAVGELGWHNPYAYTNGNPVNLVDPSGMFAEQDTRLLQQRNSCGQEGNFAFKVNRVVNMVLTGQMANANPDVCEQLRRGGGPNYVLEMLGCNKQQSTPSANNCESNTPNQAILDSIVTFFVILNSKLDAEPAMAAHIGNGCFLTHSHWGFLPSHPSNGPIYSEPLGLFMITTKGGKAQFAKGDFDTRSDMVKLRSVLIAASLRHLQLVVFLQHP